MNELLLCLLGGGVAAAVIKAIESIVTWKLNRKAAREDKAEARTEQSLAADKDAIRQFQADAATLKTGEMLILREYIRRIALEYIDRGHIDYDDRQRLLDMYTLYHGDLNGNTNVGKLVETALELPLK